MIRELVMMLAQYGVATLVANLLSALRISCVRLWCLDSQIFTDQVQKIYGIRGGYKGVAWLQTKDERIGKMGEIEKHDRYDRHDRHDRYRLMMCLYTRMTKE